MCLARQALVDSTLAASSPWWHRHKILQARFAVNLHANLQTPARRLKSARCKSGFVRLTRLPDIFIADVRSFARVAVLWPS